MLGGRLTVGRQVLALAIGVRNPAPELYAGELMKGFMGDLELELDPKRENIIWKDISNEFLTLDTIQFLDFLKTQKDEPFLSINIKWRQRTDAIRLKAFLEDSKTTDIGQKRSATIRATQEEHDLESNCFASGVKWEKVEV